VILPSFASLSRAAPSERITVAIIGCGKMANDYHIPELLKIPDVQVVAVCDVDTTRRDHAKARVEKHYGSASDSKCREFDGCRSVADFRELVSAKDVDAVCIATPDHWHAIPIIEACKAGKDVYCEKPLTLTILEAQRCVEAVTKHKRVFQTGSQQRSNVFGEFRRACELIRNGRIGKVTRVTVGVGGPSKWCDLPDEPVEPGLDWNMWLGPAPERPYHSVLSPRGVHNHFPAWRSYREYSGGGHSDMGAHHYDIAHWALDLDLSGPVEVIPPDDPTTGTGVRFIYSNGLEIVHGGPDGCVFHGSDGQLHITRGVLTTKPESILVEPLRDDELHLFASPGHHRNWIDCIKSRGKCVAPVEAGASTVTVIHLGNLAYWHGRRFEWDPKHWRLVGDDQPPVKFLDRERRDPWHLPEV
jgi:predicted dehydrogenase